MIRWGKRKTKKARRPNLMEGQNGYIFRRSRTLTGTTSRDVQATAAVNSLQLQSPRQKLHDLYEIRLRILKALCGGLLISAGLGVLVINYMVALPITYGQQGSEQPSVEKRNEYSKSLAQYLSDHPLERFGFALNNSALDTFMVGQHSELASFSTVRQWYGGGVGFVAVLRQPILVWQAGNKRFYVDDNGVAFQYAINSNQLVQVTDQSGIAPSSGSSIASRRFIYFLGKMVGAVNRGSAGKVSSVVIPASTREIDIKLAGRPYPIKTDIDRDPLQEAQDILVALQYFDAHKLAPQYIDVRVAGKAFYH
ncbi:MAG TPA: hypothetical protein VNG90_03400 [Candidatus Acidoferrum sp.]|nr:hypothetical protein [Candidatus Acidoferrum sp.]